MKPLFKYIIYTLVVLLVALIVYFIIRQASREEAILTFPDTISVVIAENVGSAPPEYIEKVSKALTYYILGYDTLKVSIAKMPYHLEKVGDIDLQAFVTQPLEKEYFIFLSNKNVNTGNLKKVLSHEFIHIKQMEEGILVQPPGQLYAIWEGDTIDYLKIPYNDRPHEIEAYKLDNRALQRLEQIWYK